MTPMDLVAILGITFIAVVVAVVMAYVLFKYSAKN
ncbi:heme/copper-type cytochrome/quinol oxidase subunit 2 [Geomicrobium sediminis]|uniref:Heme/copper-type cytochrome/quinol oxidase subunit 2 n=1 Tax=Geomicrobium sediminis TaxID=1347788 RepID=A0ABS2PBI3_9BACL|nr:heme/copper-type cytochrome/quinol oxidase subunit 2 [Geomicrobium sediminis]